jgi:hypothetical protein
MPAFNPKTLTYNVKNANNVSIHVGDVPVAFGQTTTFSAGFGTQNLYGIGSPLPQEIQQLLASMTITLDALMLTSQGRAYYGQAQTYMQVLWGNSFDITVYNSDGTVMLTYIGAVANDQAINIPTNQVLTESVTFSAQDVLDNTGTSIFSETSPLFNGF